MRWDGRMACGSWGAVFTGHSLFFSPALTALTSARLSFFVRPLIVGTVTGGSFAAESLAPALVLDAATPDAPGAPAPTVVDGVVDAFALGEASATWVPSGGTSPAGEGRASLPAAHPRDTNSANGIRPVEAESLLNRLLCISYWELTVLRMELGGM